jgi:hypothetical protein
MSLHQLPDFFRAFGLPSILAALLSSSVNAADTEFPPERFEQRVVAYEAADRESMPPKGAIMLAGDSQFYRWKTVNEDLPGYTKSTGASTDFRLQTSSTMRIGSFCRTDRV